MSKKKNKFDLGHLVHAGSLKDGQTLFFVSDPSRTCKITKILSGEFKVLDGKDILTVHQFAAKCLGQEPPDHAAKWLRTEDGKTLYELWHAEEDLDAAA